MVVPEKLNGTASMEFEGTNTARIFYVNLNTEQVRGDENRTRVRPLADLLVLCIIHPTPTTQKTLTTQDRYDPYVRVLYIMQCQ